MKFIGMLFFGCVACFAYNINDSEEYMTCERSYIAASQIGVAEDGIYISVDPNRLIKTSAVHSDLYGIYFEDYIEISDQWICPQCHAVNAMENYYCKGFICDYRR